MKHIWAPWRIEYIESEKPEGCIFCDKPAEDRDSENYILYRGSLNLVMLNAYPYNPGHLLVAPYRHISGLDQMTEEERQEHFNLVTKGVDVLKKILKPEGFNLGINLGKIAGAGIDDHIHSHIVPRWAGDTNFMTTVADIRVTPQALADSYEKLKGGF